MACAQTGSGKTAAFLLPILSRICEEGPAPQVIFSQSIFPVSCLFARKAQKGTGKGKKWTRFGDGR